MELPERANTPEKKLDVMARLLQAWNTVPELRLGQFLLNAANHWDLFSLEDFTLTEMAEKFVKEQKEN